MTMMDIQIKRGYFPDLFTWKELEYLINIRPLMTTERVFVLNYESYEWNDNDSWTLNPNCYPPSLLKQLIEDNICLMIDMSRCTEKINSFVKKLEKEYELPCDAHIYTCRNPKLDHPFGIHFDTQQNVIVQCEGQTNFKVWDEVEDKSIKCDRMELNDDPILDVDMNPGDAIWIPKYYPHLATSKTPRLSVSFSQKHKTVFQDREWINL